MEKLTNGSKKEFYIITFNKQKYKITSDQEIMLRGVANGTRVRIGETSINTSSISEIVPVEDWKDEEKKTFLPYDYAKDILKEPLMTSWTKSKKVNALKSMREGFLRGVKDANNLTPNQRVMLENMDRLILKAEKISITQITTPFTAVYGGI